LVAYKILLWKTVEGRADGKPEGGDYSSDMGLTKELGGRG
jgi:hypothetical protein